MGKKKSRISRAVSASLVDYSINEEKRAHIEKMTGWHLSDVTWALVEMATRRFLLDARPEMEGAEVEKFRASLKKVILAVVELRSLMGERSSEPLAIGLNESRYAIYLRYFAGLKSDFVHFDRPFALLEKSTDALLATATEAAHDISLKHSEAVTPGDAWEIWIMFLNEFLSRNGHSCKIRKDTDSSGRVSPFVTFVHELQATVPRQIARSKLSDSGLAKAMGRAISKHG